MKIIFLCGSLELGRDGVGDYSRRLAGELIRLGHEAFLLSVNDSYIKEVVSEIQNDNITHVPTLRIPSLLSVHQRFLLAREWINEIRPTIVSLQFVPYSFQKKGMPIEVGNELALLSKNVSWHIMFHELWLDKPTRFLQRIVAVVQKIIIYRLVNKLKPVYTNVTIPFNEIRLEDIGIKSSILPLFGNIEHGQSNSLRHTFDHVNENTINILYFGGAPRGLYLNQVLNGILEYCKNSTRKTVLVVVTPNSESKSNFIETANAMLSQFDFSVVDYNFLDSSDLSHLISLCDVGIARSEPHLIGKSGSAIAMLEHGLPVWMPKWINAEPLDIDFRKHLLFSNLQEAINFSNKPEYVSHLPEIAKKFAFQFSCN